MHPTAALMISKAIDDDRRRAAEAARRRMHAKEFARQPRRSPLSLALRIPRRLGLSGSKA